MIYPPSFHISLAEACWKWSKSEGIAWNFDKMFITSCVSCDTCHMSCVTCQVSHVTSYSQTIRARELKCWEKFHLLPRIMCHMLCVTCHMSCVTCHMSCVTCHMSHVKYIYIYIFFLTNLSSYLGEGLLSTASTLSSFLEGLKKLGLQSNMKA